MKNASKPKCDVCHGTGWVTVWHRDYRGKNPVVAAEPDAEGVLVRLRYPATLAIVCLECETGEWTLAGQGDGYAGYTTDDLHAGRIPYRFTDPSASDAPEFASDAEAVAWFGSLRDRAKALAKSLPELPQPSRKLDPAEIAAKLKALGEKGAAS